MDLSLLQFKKYSSVINKTFKIVPTNGQCKSDTVSAIWYKLCSRGDALGQGRV